MRVLAWRRITSGGRLVYWNRDLKDGRRITAARSPEGWRWILFAARRTSTAWVRLQEGTAPTCEAAKAAAEEAAGLRRPVLMSDGSRVQDCAGYRAHSRARTTGTLVILCEAAQQGIDPADGGQWLLICDPHGGSLNHPDQDGARYLMAHPDEWCPTCQEEHR